MDTKQIIDQTKELFNQHGEKETEDKSTKPDLEDHNFKINSDGWKKIIVGGQSYLENPDKDIWELLDGECRGEQLFTWDAAVRETKKAGKKIPTNEELIKLLKDKSDINNIVYPGFRNSNDSFYYLGLGLYLWSSTPNGAGAWYRVLASPYSTVDSYRLYKAYGFSVRCLKNN